jgi:hypothetical protein
MRAGHSSPESLDFPVANASLVAQFASRALQFQEIGAEEVNSAQGLMGRGLMLASRD